jgi:DNA-binding IclR family transcriptional regulator
MAADRIAGGTAAANERTVPERTSRRGRPGSRRPEQVGNSTILIGVNLLKVIANSPKPETLTQISKRVGLSISRTSRYLKSLSRAEFLKYNIDTGTYVIGPAAIELGLASVSNMDAFKPAAEAMSNLTMITGLASTLSVWGSNGPTVVRSTDAGLRISVRVKIGTNLPLPITSIGRIFLTFMPNEETQAILKRDLAAWNASAPSSKRISMAAIAKIKSKARKYGIINAAGMRNPAIAALAAPVFDENGKLRMCLALTGIVGTFDSSLTGKPARQLKAEAEALSRVLAHLNTGIS